MATALETDVAAVYAAVAKPIAHIHPDDYHRAMAALPGLLDQVDGRVVVGVLDRMRADHALASQKCTSTSMTDMADWLHAHNRCALHFRRLYELLNGGAE